MSEKRFSFSHNELVETGRPLAFLRKEITRRKHETLLSEGEQVIVTARKPKTIQHFAKNYPLTALCLRLDVTKKDTIDATVNAAIEKFGKIDVSSTTPVIVFAVPLRNAQKKKSTQSSTPISSVLFE